ncbi:hypothetical protein [Dyadobacter fermentans]|uniref:hypothetical protein n=1 Tax=Dyadobacter fermentans TaxID=94254 RepID=UPI001CC0BD59|nr:hypothetical protein [Dyadobacter fermentans]MBZ1360181.1 hypothetical protein [Dyadobacter fermentans]
MSLPERSPYIRVLTSANTLDIILKNTHFPDDLLSEASQVQCLVEWTDRIPVLVFQFKSTFYDFNEPLIPAELENSERGWLQQPSVTVRLLLSDNVVTDQLDERVFVLSRNESDKIKKIFIRE